MMTPAQAATALGDLALEDTLATALITQATMLAEAVRTSLDGQPGGQHDQPWRETGSLQASIDVATDGLNAQVGSNHPGAAAQEFGTATIPPRSFFAATAASLAGSIAHSLGETVSTKIVQRLTSNGGN